MKLFNRILFFVLLMPLTGFSASIFTYQHMGYRTALKKNNFVNISTGYSAFYNPDNTKSVSQTPLVLSVSTGQRYRVQDRLFLGYEILLSHLGSQSFEISNNETSDMVLEGGLLGTLSVFLNPYVDTHIKMGFGYQKHTSNDINMTCFNGIFTFGTGYFVSSQSQVNFDISYFNGHNAENSTQSFTTFTIGYNYYF